MVAGVVAVLEAAMDRDGNSDIWSSICWDWSRGSIFFEEVGTKLRVIENIS